MTGESGNDGQTPEGDPEPEEAERCPICLGALGRCVLAMPDSCCHLFCLSCLLRWAELQTVPSCPVDRQPFNVVYKRDAVLGCVTVPVKKRVSQSEPEKCGCTDPEASGCLLKKKGGRWRRPKTERTSEAKGLIRKCSDDDPSVLSKKKVRGPLCSWSAAQTGTAMGTMTQCIAEPLWVPEEEPEDDCKQCSRKTQDCPFLPVAVPVPASGNSRQLFHPSEWSSSPFPLRPLSPFSTTASPLGSGHFVFQGRVCAVTCPKGEEKKGTRGSGSKGPSKQTEALTTRRSGRHSRVEEQAPTQDPASSQSHSSDSDTSTNPPTKAGKSTAAAGKKKGKWAAQRKPSARRKAQVRKKASKVILSSPSGSEEEKAKEEEEEFEQQRKEVEEREQLSDTAVSPQAVQRTSSPTEEEGRPEPSACDALKDTEDHPCVDEDDLSEEEEHGKEEEEEEDGEEEDRKSSSSDVELNTPGLSPDSDQGAGEKHPDQIEDPEKSNSSTSSNSPERPLESPQSGQSGQLGEEDADAVEATNDPTEVKSDDEDSVKEEKAEVSPCPTAEPESYTGSTRCESPDGNVSQRVQGASEAKMSEEDRHDPKDVINEKPAAGSKEDGLSEDDSEAIPMDCDSPSSERSTNLASDPPKETESTAHESTSQATEDKRNGSRQERESSVREEKVEERKNGRQRKSRFHSAATTWSPKRESKQDSLRRSRSRSQERNKERQASGSRSRERDAERDAPRTDRSRERKNRKRSKSRSRSSSRSRNRSYRRGSSPERPDSGGQSPRKRDRWTGDGWRAGPGSDPSRRNFPERPARDAGRSENGGFADVSPSRENPDWVIEKARADTEARVTSGPRWEDKGWGGDRGRGTGRGRGAYGTSNQQGEQTENRWQPRNTFSGTSNNSGSDAYSRFNENRGGRRKEPEMGESMMDRSGWSSASSWAVRRTLPADVQNYYSRRDRGGGAGSGSWSRQEETSTADPAQSENNAQPNAGGEAPPALNVMPPQMNVLHYPMGPRGPPVSLQPPPFGMPPQVPMHHHSSVPLLQVPVTAAQGLPPPPPPPPPMQQGSMMAIQADSRTTQMMSSMAGHGKAPFMPTMTKVGGANTVQAHSMAMPSSTTQHSRAAPPDSSKKEKIHERAVNEVKAAMKPYYQNKDITKDEYKEIVRKAVEKVCHSKSGEVNSGKVANLVKAYVDKYKHARKK